MPRPTNSYTLVLGVLSAERNHGQRQRLRTAYAASVRDGTVLVRFLLDATGAGTASAGDEVRLPRSTGGTRTQGEKYLCAKRRTVTRLSRFWWLTISAQWDGAFYGHTEDDALVDLPMLLVLLRAFPRGRPAFAGVVRYSCLNTTTHSCDDCHAMGAVSALALRRQCRCGCDYGPFPFVLGALMLLSTELAAWVRPRVDSAYSAMASCPADIDVLLGSVLSRRRRMTVVDLGGALGSFDVLWSPTRWSGAPSVLAHRVRRPEAFELALRDFRVSHDSHGSFARYCDQRPVSRAHRRAQKRYCVLGSSKSNTSGGPDRPAAPSWALSLPCERWSHQFPRLAEFPCCSQWTICSTPSPLPFASRFRMHYREDYPLL